MAKGRESAKRWAGESALALGRVLSECTVFPKLVICNHFPRAWNDARVSKRPRERRAVMVEDREMMRYRLCVTIVMGPLGDVRRAGRSIFMQMQTHWGAAARLTAFQARIVLFFACRWNEMGMWNTVK